MEAQVAINLIRWVTYKPTWTLTPRHTPRGDVELSVTFAAPDSDVGYAPRYHVMTMPYTVFFLDVASCETAADLWRMVVECLVQVELHELREFFAVDGKFTKPYHPHVSSAEEEWHTRVAPTVAGSYRSMRITYAG